jgi:hypothetical protein
MGVINHDVVIATGYFKEVDVVVKWISKLPKRDQELFTISNIVINGEQTIFCGPDGSKEGWAESNKGNEIRALFVDQIKDHFRYVEVSFGDLCQKITKGNNRGGKSCRATKQ